MGLSVVLSALALDVSDVLKDYPQPCQARSSQHWEQCPTGSSAGFGEQDTDLAQTQKILCHQEMDIFNLQD